jgi:hypothetical protein
VDHRIDTLIRKEDARVARCFMLVNQIVVICHVLEMAHQSTITKQDNQPVFVCLVGLVRRANDVPIRLTVRDGCALACQPHLSLVSTRTY